MSIQLQHGVTIFAGSDQALRHSAVSGAFALAADVAQTRELPAEGSGFREAVAVALRADPDVLMIPLVSSEAHAKAMSDLVRAGKRVICGMAAASTDDAVGALKALGLPDDILHVTAVHTVAG
jgi:type II secretory ATPase GspE/PulE/Tfp pilus assembly ATPase PilB-like protein